MTLHFPCRKCGTVQFGVYMPEQQNMICPTCGASFDNDKEWHALCASWAIERYIDETADRTGPDEFDALKRVQRALEQFIEALQRIKLAEVEDGHAWLRRRERISVAKTRMREIRKSRSGSSGDE